MLPRGYVRTGFRHLCRVLSNLGPLEETEVSDTLESFRGGERPEVKRLIFGPYL